MAFINIIPLRNANVESAFYFVDANVWIYSLESFSNLSDWENNYYQFFYDIVDSNLDPKPKILLPILLISEITNTYLRKIAMPEYKNAEGIDINTQFEFKRDYRPTRHYTDSFEKMMDDIYSLRDSIEFICDKNIVDEDNSLLKNSIGNFDYNDYIYYSLCKELNSQKRIIMLTNDKDFQVQDFEIITANRTLLTLRNSN